MKIIQSFNNRNLDDETDKIRIKIYNLLREIPQDRIELEEEDLLHYYMALFDDEEDYEYEDEYDLDDVVDAADVVWKEIDGSGKIEYIILESPIRVNLTKEGKLDIKKEKYIEI